MEDGETEQHLPSTRAGAGLLPRLEKLWEFIRLRLQRHLSKQSGVGPHCLNLLLGSRGEPRLNATCSHAHPTPRVPATLDGEQTRSGGGAFSVLREGIGLHRPLPLMCSFLERTDVGSLTATSPAMRDTWLVSGDSRAHTLDFMPPVPGTGAPSMKCCHAGCSKRGDTDTGRTKAGWSTCLSCPRSYCRPHLQAHLCTSEHLQPSLAKGGPFRCNDCLAARDACRHSGDGCASCAEITQFQVARAPASPANLHTHISTHTPAAEGHPAMCPACRGYPIEGGIQRFVGESNDLVR